MKSFPWEKNEFYQDIRRRIETLWENVNTKDMFFDTRRQMWAQEGVPGKCSMTAFLQNQYLCWDITDRGIGVIPMIDDLRTWFDLSACVRIAGKTVDLRDGMIKRKIYYEPGAVWREYSLPQGTVLFRFSLPNKADFARIIIKLENFQDPVLLFPYLVLPLKTVRTEAGKVLAKVKHYPIFDPIVAKNNSVTADPPRTARGKTGDLEFCFPVSLSEGAGKVSPVKEKPLLLCDRLFNEKEFSKVFLGEYDGSTPLEIRAFETQAKAEKPCEGEEWEKILERVSFSCPRDRRLERQFYYSMHNSIFSRTFGENEEIIFTHGRPDHGYGDCSKPHQSYQMYFPALLAGEYASVKSELKAFSALMGKDGSVCFQLKTGGGKHHYDGPYSNAHYLLGIHRYLCFSGDFSFLQETVILKETGEKKSILACVLKAGEWLLQGKTKQGVMKPCGWLDAWPPKVTAQAQISFAVYWALWKLTDILRHIGHGQADFYEKEAKALKENIQKIFYCSDTGLYGEHLFSDGSMRGGDLEDFWVHTQVWANITGIESSEKPLEICADRCLSYGVRIIPESGLDSDYILNSTDGLSDLSVGSTATWLLSAWPELTNLFALNWIRAGNPQKAYEIVCSQLPETLYNHFQMPAPFYYAEKYLYPYGVPWLCTWAGDPTLIEYLICGLMGVSFTLDGYTVSPNLPRNLQDQDLTAKFFWRGKQVVISTNEG